MQAYNPPAPPFQLPFQTRRLKGLPFNAWYHPPLAAKLGLQDTKSLVSLLQTLVSLDTPVSDVLKKDRYCTVHRIEARGNSWVVKIHHSRPAKTKALQFIHRSHAWREWRGAQRAAITQARIVYPLALLSAPDPSEYTQIVIFPYVEAIGMQVWMKEEPAESDWSEDHRAFRLELARNVGLTFARFTRNGIVNRDFKATNIMLDHATLNEGAEPVIIDLDGVKPRYYETKVFKMMRILYHTTCEFGHVTDDEVTACLQSILEHDPSIAKGVADRESHVREKVRALLQAR